MQEHVSETLRSTELIQPQMAQPGVPKPLPALSSLRDSSLRALPGQQCGDRAQRRELLAPELHAPQPGRPGRRLAQVPGAADLPKALGLAGVI